MIVKLIRRIIFVPLALIFKFLELINNGSRDIDNKLRFKGARIENGCTITQNTTIKNFTRIFNNVIINNCNIFEYCYIGRNSLIQNTTIGSFCSIANDVIIGLGAHPSHYFSTSPIFYRKKNILNINLISEDLPFEEYKKIEIGSDVWIGARAVILDGVIIGHGAIVAANSVVTKDVPPYSIVAGIPARILKYRFSNEKIERLLKSAWWNLTILDIKENFNELNKP